MHRHQWGAIVKQFLSILIGAAIVAAAWVATFGNPLETGQPAEVARASQPGQPRAGRAGVGTMVTVAPVVVEPYNDVFRSVGTARAKSSVTVETEVSGQVTEIHFGPNQKIAAGAPLLSLDDELERIAVRAVEASLAQARATQERYETLRQANSGAITAVSLTEAITAVEIAEAELARAQYDLAQKTVRAPISGILGLTDVEQGDVLATGAEVVTITDQSALTIEFGLPDRAASALEVGQPVRLSTGSLPGRVFEGLVAGYDGQIDSTTRTIKVRARVDNAAGLMLPGMIFNAMLFPENPPLPRVPANAITWGRDGASVWLVEEGRAQRVGVAIRHRQNDMVWLDAALADGALVVVEGVQKLRPGAEVVILPSDTQDESGPVAIDLSADQGGQTGIKVTE